MINHTGVGIGTTEPEYKLDVSGGARFTSTAGGLIMPRMTTAQMNAIASPTNGEMIYNTDTNKFAGYAGGSWETITSV